MRRSLTRKVLLVALPLLATACYTHNFPDRGQHFIGASDSNRASVFVDANGTFYPSRWEQFFRPGLSWRADSLLREAEGNQALREVLAPEQERQERELAQLFQGKRRIFILVHGFNNNQGDVAEPYSIIEQRLVTGPEDALVRFHWDGYDDRIIGSPLHFWWRAVGNSQMAGSRGLRRLLAMAQPDQQVILIAHSRGASVVLSALSNPPYDQDFRGNTERLTIFQGQRPLDPDPLPRAPPNIHAILLAPAIGRVDFTSAQCEVAFNRDGQSSCDTLRDFPRLATLHFTVNPCDEVLNKYVGWSNRYNPTNIGLHEQASADILNHYRDFRRYRIETPHRHNFSHYAADPEFGQMMAAVGVATRPWAPPPPRHCRAAERPPSS